MARLPTASRKHIARPHHVSRCAQTAPHAKQRRATTETCATGELLAGGWAAALTPRLETRPARSPPRSWRGPRRDWPHERRGCSGRDRWGVSPLPRRPPWRRRAEAAAVAAPSIDRLPGRVAEQLWGCDRRRVAAADRAARSVARLCKGGRWLREGASAAGRLRAAYVVWEADCGSRSGIWGWGDRPTVIPPRSRLARARLGPTAAARPVVARTRRPPPIRRTPRTAADSTLAPPSPPPDAWSAPAPSPARRSSLAGGAAGSAF